MIELYTASLFAHEQMYSSYEEAEKALSKFCFKCLSVGIATKSLKINTDFRNKFSELHQREQYREALLLWNGRTAKGSFFQAQIFHRSIPVDDKFLPSSSFSYMIESII